MNGRIWRGACAVVCGLLLAACAPSTSRPAATSKVSAPKIRPAAAQLPDGGTTLFPHYRVVAFYGAAGTPALGVLGQGPPDAVAAKLQVQARAYAPFGRPVLPAFELIATVAEHDPGATGMYSAPSSDAVITTYLAAARHIHALLVLDIQPGYRSFVNEARRYEKFLVQPDVGLALDSEWSMSRGEVPGQTIGHTTAAAINDVSAYLARLVAERHLPQKLLVVHLFAPFMIPDRAAVVPRPGLAITFHIDGFGTRAAKRRPYGALHRQAPFYNGFKLFYRQDIDMFSAADVAGLQPPPDLITYE